ncbi:class I SAM-dependent methyltransferase [Roseobacter sp.]|uniref:class I SAM-dependent methyltransferase n=1 Tax=Roseobacter sp. TaxID=1907202 RepID=UPI00385F7AF8
MENRNSEILAEVTRYYSEKIRKYGQTPKGVDWNGRTSQELRFEQLCLILPSTKDEFSLLDLGCGYGALLDYLALRGFSASYTGLDVSEEMIVEAKRRYAKEPNAHFVHSSTPETFADYAIASGIFNVKQNRSDSEWKALIEDTLDTMDANTTRGFAFNCLTSYSDTSKKRADLFYADPCWLFDLCKQKYSRNVALLHDYGLYEFTILVRK